MKYLTFAWPQRNIWACCGCERVSNIASKLKTAVLCVSQCIEGSLNHPSVTMRVCVPQHCLSPLSLQPLNKRWRWGAGEALSHLVNAREAKDVHYYDFFYGKSSVCFGPLQGPVLAAAMSNNLQFYWQQTVKFPHNNPSFMSHLLVPLLSRITLLFSPHCVYLLPASLCWNAWVFLSELDRAGLQ